MSEAGASWWLDDNRRWRRGAPPSGWVQDRDGRWRAPAGDPAPTTEEQAVLAPWPDPPSAGPATPTRAMAVQPARHLDTRGDTGRRPSDRPKGYSSLPPWMQIAAPALAAVVVLMTAGVLLTVAKDGGSPLRPLADELGAPSDSPHVTSPTTSTSPAPTHPGDVGAPASATGADTGPAAPAGPTTTTTTATTTAPPAPNDPLAACSIGQRNLIERGNHPWDWYVARFDEDGDGVLCA